MVLRVERRSGGGGSGAEGGGGLLEKESMGARHVCIPWLALLVDPPRPPTRTPRAYTHARTHAHAPVPPSAHTAGPRTHQHCRLTHLRARACDAHACREACRLDDNCGGVGIGHDRDPGKLRSGACFGYPYNASSSAPTASYSAYDTWGKKCTGWRVTTTATARCPSSHPFPYSAEPHCPDIRRRDWMLLCGGVNCCSMNIEVASKSFARAGSSEPLSVEGGADCAQLLTHRDTITADDQAAYERKITFACPEQNRARGLCVAPAPVSNTSTLATPRATKTLSNTGACRMSSLCNDCQWSMSHEPNAINPMSFRRKEYTGVCGHPTSADDDDGTCLPTRTAAECTAMCAARADCVGALVDRNPPRITRQGNCYLYHTLAPSLVRTVPALRRNPARLAAAKARALAVPLSRALALPCRGTPRN